MVLAACDSSAPVFLGDTPESAVAPAPQMAEMGAARIDVAESYGGGSGGIAADAVQQGSTPYLIRSGSLRMEVSSLESGMDQVQAVAEAAGGYLARSATREGGNGARSADLTLRIPAPAFDEVVEELGDIGRVLAESVNVVDVSRDYVDIETRLAVREQTVERLRELARAGGGLEELLAIERELGRALEQLESLKGQLVFYDRRIAESDLEVALVEPGAVISEGAFRPLREAWREAASVFARSLASIVYVAVFILPWLLLLLMVVATVRAVWVRRARRSVEG